MKGISAAAIYRNKVSYEPKPTPSTSQAEPENVEETQTSVEKPRRGRKRKHPEPRPESLKESSEDTQEEDAQEDGLDTTENGNSTNTDLNTTSQPSPCGYQAAEAAMKWILEPVQLEEFSETILDKKPFYVTRQNSDYYTGLFSSKDFDKIMKENNRLQYGEEIDVVKYVDGTRIPTVNEMNVHPAFIWKCFKEGNSIRMRNPQIYHQGLYKLCVLLQEYFGSYVGANMYLTPPDAQGFPPHYDDIDAFILQLEGKKKWTVYNPTNAQEVLARFPSEDLNEEDLGEIILEAEVCVGDLLYFPRGYIHQAKTVEGEHSLHITLSTNQLNTWGDLLLVGMKHAVEEAIKNEGHLRETLPLHYMNYVGCSYAKCDSAERRDIKKKLKDAALLAVKYLSVDHAADQQALDFIYGSAPPFFDQVEKANSVHGNGCQIKEDGKVICAVGLRKETKIRWIRKRILRLVMDDDGIRLYHTLNNSKSHKECEASFIEVDSEAVPAINFLFQSYPKFVRVADLPAQSFKVRLAQELYDNGLLMTEEPLAREADKKIL